MKTGSTRRLVLHADDFGMNHAINRGILHAFRNGLLTSTSLLANAPHASAACREWRSLITQHQSSELASSNLRNSMSDSQLPFDLGIHLNLTQGQPLTGSRFPAELLDRDGNFPGIGNQFLRLQRSNPACLSAVASELQAQIEWMCDQGLRPTHLNGHQYIELIPGISAMIPILMSRYAIPVVRVALEPSLARNVLFCGRIADWGLGLVKRYYANQFRRQMLEANIQFPDRFFGTSHAGRISHAVFDGFLTCSDLVGLTEVGMHPGVEPDQDDGPVTSDWNDPLANVRPAELRWLCDPALANLLQQKRICLGRLQSLNSIPMKAAG